MENECCICLEKINNTTLLQCKHKFHKKCIEKWLQKNNNCPLCRAPIKNVFNTKLVIDKFLRKNIVYNCLLCSKNKFFGFKEKNLKFNYILQYEILKSIKKKYNTVILEIFLTNKFKKFKFKFSNNKDAWYAFNNFRSNINNLILNN